MNSISWFRFEDKEWDFPFYRHNPRVPKSGWVVLFLSVIIGFIGTAFFQNQILGGFFFFIVELIPVLYYLRWDIKAILRVPKAKHVALAFAMFVGYMIYALVMGEVLDMVGLAGSDIVEESAVTINMIISLVFSMMGEELLKFIPFMFFLRLCYKYSDNRKLSVVISMFIVMFCFGLLHAVDVKSIISVLLLQGLGTIFEFYGYIKTKNIFVSYLSHLFTDVFVFVIIFLNIG